MDGIHLTDILLAIIGFLVVYVLNGIKTEIKEVKMSMDRLERELNHSISDLDKRVAIIEDSRQ